MERISIYKDKAHFCSCDSVTMLLVKSLLWSPAVHVIVLAIGTLTSFLIAFSRGDVNLYLPFISETGAYTPEMCIFSFFLYLGSLVGIFIIGIRFLLILQRRNDRTFTCINYISFIIGIFSMLGLAGVAAFPLPVFLWNFKPNFALRRVPHASAMTTVFWAHLLAAAVYFVGSALYFACSTLMTWKAEGLSKKFILRCTLTVIILILLFILMICFPISLHRWHEFNSVIPALKEPTNKGFGMVLLCSILEWSVVGVIIAYTFTFMSEMKNHGLLLTIAPIKNECDAAEVQESTREVKLPTPSTDEMS